jgi:hypothetical protein
VPNRNWPWSRVLSPFLYAAVVPMVAFLVVAAIAALEGTVGLRTWYRVGDVDTAIALAFIGTVLFGVATRVLIRFERLDVPGIPDHLRHSVLLYVVGGTSCIALVAFYSEMNGALQYAYLAILFSASVFGICMNAAFLALRARRKHFAGADGARH